ncbi:MAG TPA: ATP-binding protein [Solirubrobacteraceae bacterium]
MSAETSLEELRTVDLFDDLDDDELARWVPLVHVREAAAGETLTRDEGTTFRLLFDGELTITGADGELWGTQVAPTWLGAIPALTQTPLAGQLIARTDVRLGEVANEAFIDLVLSQRAVHQRVMAQVRPVIARSTQREQNRERLASLGTMAAGLTHELNNPAAAARRAAADLVEALDVISGAMRNFVEAGIERSDAERLVELQQSVAELAASGSALDALDAADAEDALSDELEALGIEEPWRLAEPLARARVDKAWLDDVQRHAGPATGAAVRWVAATLTAANLAAELEESTDRMSKLVAAVKTYAYMDRGELVEVDVHEGIDMTLVVLGHKLKHTTIEVVRDYDRAIPKVTVHGSELNQVWTNLLANAIDALGDSGTITISTRLDGDCLEVDVADDGPGVAEDVRDRVFDPFFTTKDVGAGTGMGLDTSRRIVVDRHRGSLTLHDAPGGGALFRVRLPIAAQ